MLRRRKDNTAKESHAKRPSPTRPLLQKPPDLRVPEQGIKCFIKDGWPGRFLIVHTVPSQSVSTLLQVTLFGDTGTHQRLVLLGRRGLTWPGT